MKKIIKRLVGIVVITALSRGAFSPQGLQINEAHAQDASTTQDTKQGIVDFMDFIIKNMYIVLWPLLFIAGLAMDNSMVYGSFLHMDAPLWQFWNMAKNFANFALGFMVLYSILKSIFSLDGGKGPMDIIKKTLIAGVLIQASWFLTSAVIDISTIATYAIGGMPISIMKTNTAFQQNKILMTDSTMDFNNMSKLKPEQIKTFYKAYVRKDPKDQSKGKTEVLLSKCLVKTINNIQYIVGREDGDPKFNHTTDGLLDPEQKKDPKGMMNACIFNQKVIFFNEFPPAAQTKDPIEYKDIQNLLIEDIGNYYEDLEACGFYIRTSFKKQENNTLPECGQYFSTIKKEAKRIERDTVQYYDRLDSKPKIDPIFTTNKNNDQNEAAQQAGNTRFLSGASTTIGEVIQGSKGFVGPLVTIYAGLLDFGTLADTSYEKESLSKVTGEVILKALTGIGLVFPLLALAIVLIGRIGFLRLVIATSPLLILNKVFDRKIGGKNLELGNILNTIFAPVITVFALSMSLIFMTALHNMLNQSNISQVENTAFRQNRGAETKEDSNTKTICFYGYCTTYSKTRATTAGATGDRFSRMLINFCGIGVMRFVIFAAIKASGTIGDAVGKKIQDFGQNVFSTMPIVPIGSGVKASFSSIGKVADMPEEVVSNIKKEQSGEVTDYMHAKFKNLYQEGVDTNITDNVVESREFNKRFLEGKPEDIKAYAAQQNIDLGASLNANSINALTEQAKKDGYTQEQIDKVKKNATDILRNTNPKDAFMMEVKGAKNLDAAKKIIQDHYSTSTDAISKAENLTLNNGAPIKIDGGTVIIDSGRVVSAVAGKKKDEAVKILKDRGIKDNEVKDMKFTFDNQPHTRDNGSFTPVSATQPSK